MHSSLKMLRTPNSCIKWWGCWLALNLICVCASAEEVRIVQGPETISVLDGTAALFVCKAEGSPAPEIEWLINDKRPTMDMSRFFSFAISFGKVLRIDPTRASEDNNTKVACVATNVLGGASNIVVARLYVYWNRSVSPSGFPRIMKGPRLILVEKDQRVVLTCEVVGTPMPKVVWVKDYVPIETGSQRYQLESISNLIIKQALPEDEGRYICIASNEHGSVESNEAQLFVRVRRRPSLGFSTRPSNVEVNPGSDANITCVAVGWPTPTLHWYDSNGQPLKNNEKIKIGKNVLYLTDIRADDSYTCSAENAFGSINVIALVKVLKPKPPTELRVVNPGPRAVTVEFKRSRTLEVRSYTVSYKEGSSSAMPNQNWIKIEGVPNRDTDGASPGIVRIRVRDLKPYTKYQLKVDSVTAFSSSVTAENNTVIVFMTKKLDTAKRSMIPSLSDVFQFLSFLHCVLTVDC